MSNGVFKLDGIDYNVNVISLKRNFEVADSDATGRTKDWVMHRDVVGTFYNYTLEVAVKDFDYDSYDAFYEAISLPYASHSLQVPYGQSGTLTFQAYCTKGSDNLIHIYKKRSKNLFNGLSVNFIAMEPQRKA